MPLPTLHDALDGAPNTFLFVALVLARLIILNTGWTKSIPRRGPWLINAKSSNVRGETCLCGPLMQMLGAMRVTTVRAIFCPRALKNDWRFSSIFMRGPGMRV